MRNKLRDSTGGNNLEEGSVKPTGLVYSEDMSGIIASITESQDPKEMEDYLVDFGGRLLEVLNNELEGQDADMRSMIVVTFMLTAQFVADCTFGDLLRLLHIVSTESSPNDLN